MEEGPHIPAKLLPKQISKVSGQKGRKTYPCDPKICQQEYIRTQGGMEAGVRRGDVGHCGWVGLPKFGSEPWFEPRTFEPDQRFRFSPVQVHKSADRSSSRFFT